MATNEQPTEEQLKEQLDNICLEYQDLIDKSQDMAPKETKNVDPKSDGALEEDIQEIASVSDNLDSLASALDLIEERADRIREQLLQLLSSNREIRESLRQENADDDSTKDSEIHDSDEAPAEEASNASDDVRE